MCNNNYVSLAQYIVGVVPNPKNDFVLMNYTSNAMVGIFPSGQIPSTLSWDSYREMFIYCNLNGDGVFAINTSGQNIQIAENITGSICSGENGNIYLWSRSPDKLFCIDKNNVVREICFFGSNFIPSIDYGGIPIMIYHRETNSIIFSSVINKPEDNYVTIVGQIFLNEESSKVVAPIHTYELNVSTNSAEGPVGFSYAPNRSSLPSIIGVNRKIMLIVDTNDGDVKIRTFLINPETNPGTFDIKPMGAIGGFERAAAIKGGQIINDPVDPNNFIGFEIFTDKERRIFLFDQPNSFPNGVPTLPPFSDPVQYYLYPQKAYTKPASQILNEPLDSDGDGLLDDWEINGIDTDGDCQPDFMINLPPYNAKWNHKDIFLEIDWASPELAPTKEALIVVENAFKNAPVNNLDSSTGITLHIDAGAIYASTIGLNDGKLIDGQIMDNTSIVTGVILI